jgi:hypothetical protein
MDVGFIVLSPAIVLLAGFAAPWADTTPTPTRLLRTERHQLQSNRHYRISPLACLLHNHSRTNRTICPPHMPSEHRYYFLIGRLNHQRLTDTVGGRAVDLAVARLSSPVSLPGRRLRLWRRGILRVPRCPLPSSRLARRCRSIHRGTQRSCRDDRGLSVRCLQRRGLLRPATW